MSGNPDIFASGCLYEILAIIQTFPFPLLLNRDNTGGRFGLPSPWLTPNPDLDIPNYCMTFLATEFRLLISKPERRVALEFKVEGDFCHGTLCFLNRRQSDRSGMPPPS